MKAAFFLWKRRLRWIVLLSVVLAVAMGVFSYLYIPVRYEAVSEVLMLESDAEAINALADEAIHWSRYDALKTGTLTAAQWGIADCSVDRYGNTGILLVKVISTDAEIAADAANTLAGTLAEVINKAANAAELKVVVQAGVPESPIFLYRERLIAAVLAGAFVLFGLLSLIGCAVKPKLIRAKDVSCAVNQPVVAEIPDLRGLTGAYLRFKPEASPILYDFAGFATHEQLRQLSLAIRFRAKQDQLKSLAFVSRTDDEFRTETLVMLAQELCRQGSRVLLVDMNWYAPMLGVYLQAKGERDLIHCLVSSVPFEQAAVQTETRNLYFLDQNHSQSMAAQLSASASFSALLDAMYAKFDFVLFDMPRADLFSDALAMTGVLHAYVPVIKAKRWTAKDVMQWIKPMQKLERKSLGLVITGVAQKRMHGQKKLDRNAGI